MSDPSFSAAWAQIAGPLGWEDRGAIKPSRRLCVQVARKCGGKRHGHTWAHMLPCTPYIIPRQCISRVVATLVHAASHIHLKQAMGPCESGHADGNIILLLSGLVLLSGEVLVSSPVVAAGR